MGNSRMMQRRRAQQRRMQPRAVPRLAAAAATAEERYCPTLTPSRGVCRQAGAPCGTAATSACTTGIWSRK